MEKEEYLRRHLELCKKVYERMKRDGSWPWKDGADSQDSEDLLESKDN